MVEQGVAGSAAHPARRIPDGPLGLLMRVPVPWVFVLTYLAGAGLERLRPSSLRLSVPIDRWWAGMALFAAGAAVAGWALSIFNRARTTTVPGKASRALVTWGPYQFTRNPMYVGLTLFYLGEACTLGQWWPAALLPLTLIYLNWVVIPVEESRLAEVFGSEYRRLSHARPPLDLIVAPSFLFHSPLWYMFATTAVTGPKATSPTSRACAAANR